MFKSFTTVFKSGCYAEYRGWLCNKCIQILLSKSLVGPGRKDKQEQERRRLEKERDKIKDKIGGKSIIGTPNENPKTFRE